MKRIVVHTDGACLGNPGPGGWAAILVYGPRKKEFVGGALATTNNRMELQAAIEALSRLKESCEVELFTDSEYLREGIIKWIHAWKASGWKKKVKNKDLWQALDTAAAKHKVTWHWVRGHSGNPGNEPLRPPGDGRSRAARQDQHRRPKSKRSRRIRKSPL